MLLAVQPHWETAFTTTPSRLVRNVDVCCFRIYSSAHAIAAELSQETTTVRAMPAHWLAIMTTPRMPMSKATINEKPALRKVLSTATVGFLSSSAAERAPLERMKPSVEAFRKFLTTSGLGAEISSSLNFSLLPRLGLLSQIQTILNERNDRRMLSRVVTTRPNNLPTSHEALKYMRYATAVYGVDMIAAGGRKQQQPQKRQSSQEDAKTTKEKTNPKDTRTWISEHIGVPPDNIVVLDVDYSPETNHDHLRHFVAVDHASQKVVLSIRGTFSLSEIMVDITAYSRPCPFGGEAHAEIYNMAEKIWAASGEKIVDLLRKYEGYELIVTGHSLGAGCACVINMMCQCDDRKLIEGRSIRCFAFACPPVFGPSTSFPKRCNRRQTTYSKMTLSPSCRSILYDMSFIVYGL